MKSRAELSNILDCAGNHLKPEKNGILFIMDTQPTSFSFQVFLPPLVWLVVGPYIYSEGVDCTLTAASGPAKVPRRPILVLSIASLSTELIMNPVHHEGARPNKRLQSTAMDKNDN